MMNDFLRVGVFVAFRNYCLPSLTAVEIRVTRIGVERIKESRCGGYEDDSDDNHVGSKMPRKDQPLYCCILTLIAFWIYIY